MTARTIARSPSSLAPSLGRRELALGAGQHHLLRRVVVGEREPVARRRSRRPASAASAPSTRDHRRRRRAVVARLVHQPAAQRHQLAAPARSSSAPAATSAPSSPSEWPAMNSLDRRAERRPAGEARAEDRGLGEVGAVVDPQERVLADDLDRAPAADLGARARPVRASRASGCPGLETGSRSSRRLWGSASNLGPAARGLPRRRRRGTRLGCSSASTYVEVLRPVRRVRRFPPVRGAAPGTLPARSR